MMVSGRIVSFYRLLYRILPAYVWTEYEFFQPLLWNFPEAEHNTECGDKSCQAA